VRFADSPVVANLLKAFEGGFKPARGAVDLLLNEGGTAEDEEREAGVRTRTRHLVAKLAQTTVPFIEEVFLLAVLACRYARNPAMVRAWPISSGSSNCCASPTASGLKVAARA
jgi:hypothetical protein